MGTDFSSIDSYFKTPSPVKPNIIRSPAKSSIFDQLSDDVIVAIVSFNIDQDGVTTMISLASVNQRFYTALNPNHPAVNMIWRQICLYKLPYTPSTLRMKRWDQFLKYKLFKIHARRKQDADYKFFSDADFNDSVVVNCEHDIEEMNGLHSEHAFKDKVAANGLPDGFEWNYKCPVLSDEMKRVSDTIRYCDVCKKNVYQVKDAQELQQRVDNNECVSLQVYDGIYYRPNASGYVTSYTYDRNLERSDPHRDKRDDPYYRVRLTSKKGSGNGMNFFLHRKH